VHLAYLAFIPVGGMLAVRWRRLLWPHLAAVTIGVLSITVGFDCPLTSWEQSLRLRGGQRPSSDGFVAHYLTGTIYPHGYAWVVQLVFAICVVASYALILSHAPRRPRYGRGR